MRKYITSLSWKNPVDEANDKFSRARAHTHTHTCTHIEYSLGHLVVIGTCLNLLGQPHLNTLDWVT